MMPPSAGLVIHGLMLVVCYAVDRRVYPQHGMARLADLALPAQRRGIAELLPGRCGHLSCARLRPPPVGPAVAEPGRGRAWRPPVRRPAASAPDSQPDPCLTAKARPVPEPWARIRSPQRRPRPATCAAG
jgi:hypothetical protein